MDYRQLKSMIEADIQKCIDAQTKSEGSEKLYHELCGRYLIIDKDFCLGMMGVAKFGNVSIDCRDRLLDIRSRLEILLIKHYEVDAGIKPSSNPIRDILNQEPEIRKCFVITKGGKGFPDLNTLKGSKFRTWLGEIMAAVSKLKQDKLNEAILKLADGFKGWTDESDFEKLIGKLQALEKNYHDYIIEEKEIKRDKEKISVDTRKVFVVHGRNAKIRNGIFEFLRAIGVQPIEWNEARNMTGKASPYINEVLDVAFNNAQAIMVLLTPDDEAKLKDEFINHNDDDYEKKLTGQARPNVIFEAGMAFGRDRDRTILLEFGKLRPFSDIGGINTIKMNNNASKRKSVCDALKTAKVSINIDGKTDWLSVGDFEL